MSADLVAAGRIVNAGVERVRRLDPTLSIAAIIFLTIGGVLLADPARTTIACVALASAVVCTAAACVLDRRGTVARH